MEKERVVGIVKKWLSDIVIDLNLCPFAKKEFIKNSIRYLVSEAKDTEQLAFDLDDELKYLQANPEIETTLIIHPNVLADFMNYNDFLSFADDLLVHLRFDGIFQIASFHPDYRFEGLTPDAVENYTNRAPFPMLHLLREESVSRAIDTHPDIGSVPKRNAALMRNMGLEKMRGMLGGVLWRLR